jgi:hypothetical protein
MQAVATLLALSFNELLIEEIPHGPDRTAYIGTFYMVTNGVSACIQFFGLRQMFKRLPVGNVLLMMPCVISILALGALTNFR